MPRCFSSGALSMSSNANCGFRSAISVVQDLRDRSRQRRLTVVDVTDGADVDVRLGPLELRRHLMSSSGLFLVNADTTGQDVASYLGGWLDDFSARPATSLAVTRLGSFDDLLGHRLGDLGVGVEPIE